MKQVPYDGPERIIFGIDIGTSMTAVSFVHLRHREIPKVRLVCRWPGQEQIAGETKCPTAILYDVGGQPHSFGAAAVEAAGDEMYLVRWWKLLLHPAAMHRASGITTSPLPDPLTLHGVYRDFIRHIFDHAVAFFRETQANATATWERLQSSFELVFAIPNGWADKEQLVIRNAVLDSDILPPDHADHRLAFVPEAEASVHFALEDMGFDAQLSVGLTFTVLDAGGSTVDTTMYRCTAVYPQVRLQEVTSSECVEAGSILVNKEFEKFLRMRLINSDYGRDTCISTIMQVFETKIKRSLRMGDKAYSNVIIPFGATGLENDFASGIKDGKLFVPREEIESAFDQAVARIVASVHRILDRAGRSCKACLLVGGFSESPYLRQALQKALDGRLFDFVMTDQPTSKAAAVGACIWRIRHYVTARAARFTFGVSRWEHWEPEKFPQQLERRQHLIHDSNGEDMVPGCLKILVRKNQVVDGDSPISTPLRWDGPSPESLGLETWSLELISSDAEDPGYWAKQIEGNLSPGLRTACTLEADLSGTRGALERYTSTSGKTMYQVEYNVEVYFGKTSLSAYITWKEKGKIKKFRFSRKTRKLLAHSQL